MLISIVICTYNRANILKITLPFYLALKIPKDAQLEVIIVDNNSSDETESVVKNFINKNKSDADFYYTFEAQQGLSYARNTGYKYAKGEYIGYLDDECIVPENWLAVALQDIELASPAFLGGPYYGKYLPGSSSKWYKESFGDSYILQYNLPDGPMKQKYLSGGNLIIRRDVFDKIGLFDITLGMNGETIAYGEEQDFQKRLVAKYPEEIIFYDSKLFVWHCIRDEKMSIPYLFKEALIRGATSAKMGDNSIKKLAISPLLFSYFVIKALISALLKLAQSFVSKDHFFTLLYQDYKNSVWRDIGSSFYRSKLLLSRLLGLNSKND